MPDFFEAWLKSLNPQQADAVWGYFLDNPQARMEVILLVVPIALSDPAAAAREFPGRVYYR